MQGKGAAGLDGGSARFRAGIREALAGGHRGRAAERDAARRIGALYPRSAGLVTAAWDFHSAAALWAVTETRRASPAGAVIFTAAGLPRPEPAGEPLHCAAARTAPDAGFCYAEADPEVTWMRQVVMADACRDRVRAVTAAEDEPERVLAAAQAAGLPVAGPVSVHLILCAQYWDDGKARDVLRRYAAPDRDGKRLLAPGSSVCLSVADPAPTAVGDAYLTGMREILGCEIYRHGPQAVASWIAGAGMVLHPQGVTDCRAFGRPGLQPELEQLEPVVRVLEAVGIVPR